MSVDILSLLAGREVFLGRFREPLKSCIPTALALLLMAFAMIVRTISALVEDPPLGETTPFYDPTQDITLLVNTICGVAIALGFLMMANERLGHHYEKLHDIDEAEALQVAE